MLTRQEQWRQSQSHMTMFFPFSLRDRAKTCLQSLLANSIMTWNELMKVFLARYFPPSKTIILRNQVTCFKKDDGEFFFDVWERYKNMMNRCPHHGLEQWLIIHALYDGLLYNTRMAIDVAARWALMGKPFAKAYNLIENMTHTHY